MMQGKRSKSAAIRARLDFPVIDSDGHTIEFEPGLLDHLRQVGGHELIERFYSWKSEIYFTWYGLSPAQRRDKRIPRQAWWGLPTKNTLDRATATLPKLRYERMDDLGLDFAMIYPSLGLPIPHIEDEELRR
ncbi:MAG: amidohydrolase family protein, partial [Nitrospiraceae bacterium]